jgi:UDP-glucose 4-epimerase
MAEGTTVLVTGVAGYWGARLAARLAVEPGYAIIGLDSEPPADEFVRPDIPRLDFVRADVRNPLLADLLRAEGVGAVCHLAFRHSRRRSEAAFDLNVMGTTKLLGACGEAGVGKVVLKSSMAVYGACVRNPSFLTEEHELHGSRRYGHVRDLVEIEVLCNGFRRREPGVALTVLRFPSIVGPTATTPMTRFLREPWAPSLLGFDPMMQVIHEDDVIEALVHALAHDAPGVYNVAAEGVLPLSKVRGLADKPPLVVFHKFADWGTELLSLSRLGPGRFLPIEPEYLRYPWVGDLTKMRQVLGFAPRHTAEQALREFAQGARLARYEEPASDARAQARLQELIDERRRARREQAPPASGPERRAPDE